MKRRTGRAAPAGKGRQTPRPQQRKTPAPHVLPVSAKGIVIFGGSFDPPHRWHVAAARAARERLFGRAGWIVFIPAAQSPLKAEGPVASDADRVAMLRLATGRLRRSVVWTEELERPGPSYTIDTLRRLRALCPRTPLRLLIGADQAVVFHRWRRFREVLALAEPAVVLRPPLRTRAALRRQLERTGAWSADELDAWSGRVVPLPVRSIASRDVRAALTLGGGRAPTSRTRAAIPAAVLRYIQNLGLYDPPPERSPRPRRRPSG